MRAADSDACNRAGACRAFGYVGRDVSVSLLCVDFLAVEHHSHTIILSFLYLSHTNGKIDAATCAQERKN